MNSEHSGGAILTGTTLRRTYQEYIDRVLGAWIGKSLGGIVGAPFEAHKIQGDMTAANCWPENIAPNDDLDIQVVWLEMLEEIGPSFTQSDLVAFWQDRCWYNFAEYGCFLYNVQRGIHPPLSGSFNNAYYSESMGCPIRAEIWGLVAPGNPQLAAHYAKLDGELDHTGNSVWAEQFWAAAISNALISQNLDAAMDAGRSVVPADSDICRVSHEVADLYSQYGNWKRIWRELIRKYGHRDNSKVLINFAFTILSLLNGKCDLKATIVTAINCGWDSDCTAATAGALVGVLKGAKALPLDWVQRMGDRLTCDVNVRHKKSLLDDFALDTCRIGLEISLTTNGLIEFVDVPGAVFDEVNDRLSKRSVSGRVIIASEYPDEPVLYLDRPTSVVLRVANNGNTPVTGKLSIQPIGSDILISPDSAAISLPPKHVKELSFSVAIRVDSSIVWDKNLLSASMKLDDGSAVDHVFGFAGSRQWNVYGPYWDAWDTSKSEICPYRNEKTISHPIFVEGCTPMMNHQCVRLDKEYIDERILLHRDIEEEYPILVQRGEDYIDLRHLGGFVGEACYYLVREIYSREPVECSVSIGCTSPFVLWMDGREMLRVSEQSAWYFEDYTFHARFGNTPHRIVIKCANASDFFRLSMCFIKVDIPGDKTVGVSYFLDHMGDKILSPRSESMANTEDADFQMICS